MGFRRGFTGRVRPGRRQRRRGSVIAIRQRRRGLTVRYTATMRYLVRARVKEGREAALLEAIESEELGAGSIAGDEYLRDMAHAREMSDGTVRWVEVCYCPIPLMEERPYWEEYFELTRVQDAHARLRCRDENGTEPWACSECDCTRHLETRLAQTGSSFLERLHGAHGPRPAESTQTPGPARLRTTGCGPR